MSVGLRLAALALLPALAAACAQPSRGAGEPPQAARKANANAGGRAPVNVNVNAAATPAAAHSEADYARITDLYRAYFRQVRSIIAQSAPSERIVLASLQLVPLDVLRERTL